MGGEVEIEYRCSIIGSGSYVRFFLCSANLCKLFFFFFTSLHFVWSGWFGWVLGDWLGRTVVDRSLVGEAGKVFC